MCIAPVFVSQEHGPSVEVGCRECWQCRKERVNDYVGRCIAEEKTSVQTVAVTLTYAGDGPHTQTLVYADVQLFLKRLRKNVGKVRYIVTGEYGSAKGRAHWHIILFLQERELLQSRCECKWKNYCHCDHVPTSILFNRRFIWSLWDHGISYIQRPDYGAFSYVLKYVLKDLNQEVRRTHLSMSKKPPLGFQYFMDLADTLVEQKITPTSPEYMFRDVFDRKGKRRRYLLRGRMRHMFIERWKARYVSHHKEQPPHTEFLVEMEDKWERERQDLIGVRKTDDFYKRPDPPKEQRVLVAQEVTITIWDNGNVDLNFANGDEWKCQNGLDAALVVNRTKWAQKRKRQLLEWIERSVPKKQDKRKPLGSRKNTNRL